MIRGDIEHVMRRFLSRWTYRGAIGALFQRLLQDASNASEEAEPHRVPF